MIGWGVQYLFYRAQALIFTSSTTKSVGPDGGQQKYMFEICVLVLNMGAAQYHRWQPTFQHVFLH